MEIPEPIQFLFIAAVLSFVVIMIEPPAINYITPNISAFTNVTKTIPITVENADNITKLVYQYNGITNLSKSTGMDKKEIFVKLRASSTFPLQCRWVKQLPNDTSYMNAMYCSVLHEKFFYMDSPYDYFGYLSDYTNDYCHGTICQYRNAVMLLS